MANRKNKRKPKSSNVKNLKKNTVATTKSVERDIEKFKFYSVVVQTVGMLIISFKAQILKWINQLHEWINQL